MSSLLPPARLPPLQRGEGGAIIAKMDAPVEVYLEVGAKRVFAGALRWPGWCRSGRDEGSALQALVDHGPRYAAAIGNAAPDFRPPVDLTAFEVRERLPGDATTDFGAQAAARSSRGRTRRGEDGRPRTGRRRRLPGAAGGKASLGRARPGRESPAGA